MKPPMSFRRNWKRYALVGLLVANLLVWVAIYQRHPSQVLSVYFLDVGQGDAILIESPNRGRILIDGGANRKVLSELGKILAFGDKRIDVVVATHPDKDHIGGLPEVVSRYHIGAFIESGVETDSTLDAELKRRLEVRDIPVITARRGLVVDLGGGAELTVFFPNQDVSKWETNAASIVAKLTYGEESFLLTGDAPARVENILISLDPNALKSSVLKAGHHGSRTSTTLSFAQAVSAEYAVISAARDNSYGHPHEEVLNNLKA